MVNYGRNGLPNLTNAIHLISNNIECDLLSNHTAITVGNVILYFYRKSSTFNQAIKQLKAIVVINQTHNEFYKSRAWYWKKYCLSTRYRWKKAANNENASDKIHQIRKCQNSNKETAIDKNTKQITYQKNITRKMKLWLQPPKSGKTNFMCLWRARCYNKNKEVWYLLFLS